MARVKGFTLIELLIVIAIIAVLMATVVLWVSVTAILKHENGVIALPSSVWTN